MRVYTMYSRGRAEGSCGHLLLSTKVPAYSFFAETNSKVANRKRLYHIIFIMLAGNKLQNSFVNGASYREFEVGVMAELHIGKVLM